MLLSQQTSNTSTGCWQSKKARKGVSRSPGLQSTWRWQLPNPADRTGGISVILRHFLFPAGHHNAVPCFGGPKIIKTCFLSFTPQHRENAHTEGRRATSSSNARTRTPRQNENFGPLRKCAKKHKKKFKCEIRRLSCCLSARKERQAAINLDNAAIPSQSMRAVQRLGQRCHPQNDVPSSAARLRSGPTQLSTLEGQYNGTPSRTPQGQR